MALFINKLTGGFSASAKVVDGTLILSLPDAISPVVWRMELGHAKSSAIEVREQDNGTFMLTLKTARWNTPTAKSIPPTQPSCRPKRPSGA